MTKLPSHGTGWAETELVMDVVTLYDEWDGESTPNFDNVIARTRTFQDNELRNLWLVLTALGSVITSELAHRGISIHED